MRFVLHRRSTNRGVQVYYLNRTAEPNFMVWFGSENHSLLHSLAIWLSVEF